MPVVVHYKPSRPTRTLDLGTHPDTGKPWRRLVTSNTTTVLPGVEAERIKAAAAKSGISKDFTFEELPEAEAAPLAEAPAPVVSEPPRRGRQTKPPKAE